MRSEGETKTLVQCDFDGTITEEDVSFMLLDTFADGDWRRLYKEHEEGKMSVGRFNTEAFALVKADRQTLVKAAKTGVKIRPGFHKLVACCRRKAFRLLIVSNGLDFYINEILKDMSLGDIEVFAAQTRFSADGLKVQYVGPDGSHLDEDFKDAYVNLFLKEGYRVIYIGNGTSDFPPARQCHYVFATSALLTRCQQTRLGCTPFTNFNEVVRVLELW